MFNHRFKRLHATKMNFVLKKKKEKMKMPHNFASNLTNIKYARWCFTTYIGTTNVKLHMKLQIIFQDPNVRGDVIWSDVNIFSSTNVKW